MQITEVTDGGSINNAGEIINNSTSAAIYSDGAGDVEITNSGLISSEGNIAIYSTGSNNFTLNILEGSIINGQVYAVVTTGGSFNLNIQTDLTGSEYSALASKIASIESYTSP